MAVKLFFTGVPLPRLFAKEYHTISVPYSNCQLTICGSSFSNEKELGRAEALDRDEVTSLCDSMMVDRDQQAGLQSKPAGHLPRRIATSDRELHLLLYRRVAKRRDTGRYSLMGGGIDAGWPGRPRARGSVPSSSTATRHVIGSAAAPFLESLWRLFVRRMRANPATLEGSVWLLWEGDLILRWSENELHSASSRAVPYCRGAGPGLFPKGPGPFASFDGPSLDHSGLSLC